MFSSILNLFVSNLMSGSLGGRYRVLQPINVSISLFGREQCKHLLGRLHKQHVGSGYFLLHNCGMTDAQLELTSRH